MCLCVRCNCVYVCEFVRISGVAVNVYISFQNEG